MKKPAHRSGATAGLSNAFRQVSKETYALEATPRQASHLVNRFGLSPRHAALIAELAFPVTDNWQGRA